MTGAGLGNVHAMHIAHAWLVFKYDKIMSEIT